MYRPHITVVRGKYETPTNLEAWGKYAGKRFSFDYSTYINEDRTYFWLSVYSEEIMAIRAELGLTAHFDRFKKFHITIANRKGLRNWPWPS